MIATASKLNSVIRQIQLRGFALEAGGKSLRGGREGWGLEEGGGGGGRGRGRAGDEKQKERLWSSMIIKNKKKGEISLRFVG